MSLLVTCELGGDKVPAWFRSEARLGIAETPLVNPEEAEPPRGSAGIDDEMHRKLIAAADHPGRHAATRIAASLGAELIVNEYSSALIDVTHSLGHRQLFSKFTRSWSRQDRKKLVDLVYRPYRERVQAAIQGMLSTEGVAIHLSVRSFNLRSRGKIRRTDVGLLYDPARRDEVDFCLDWIDELWDQVPMLRVRRNYPRRGTACGLTRWLRKEFVGQDYLVVEVWLNRAWAKREVAIRDEAISGICGSLRAILDDDVDSQTAAA